MTVDRTRESAIDSFESSGGLAQFVGEELNKKTNQRERNLPKDTELVFFDSTASGGTANEGERTRSCPFDNRTEYSVKRKVGAVEIVDANGRIIEADMHLWRGRSSTAPSLENATIHKVSITGAKGDLLGEVKPYIDVDLAKPGVPRKPLREEEPAKEGEVAALRKPRATPSFEYVYTKQNGDKESELLQSVRFDRKGAGTPELVLTTVDNRTIHVSADGSAREKDEFGRMLSSKDANGQSIFYDWKPDLAVPSRITMEGPSTGKNVVYEHDDDKTYVIQNKDGLTEPSSWSVNPFAFTGVAGIGVSFPLGKKVELDFIGADGTLCLRKKDEANLLKESQMQFNPDGTLTMDTFKRYFFSGTVYDSNRVNYGRGGESEKKLTSAK